MRILLSALWRTTALILAVLFLLLAIAAGLLVGNYYQLEKEGKWPHISQLRAKPLGENSSVFSATGSRLGVIAAAENRRLVDYDQMGAWAPRALVSIEDRRFWEHNGVDPQGILRAARANQQAGDTVQGGSTIDQQLVRNLYEEVGTEASLERKIKEASLAWELNRKWTDRYGKREAKERILELYLNTVFFGNNAYGIEAAAQTYFDKPAAELGPVQAALLVGLVQNPVGYDPFEHPEQALARRNEVLAAICQERHLNPAVCDKVQEMPLSLKPGRLFRARNNPYVFDHVRGQVQSMYGKEAVDRGGLHITTSISPRLQRIAMNGVRNALDRSSDPEAAMVIIENKTGYVRAMATTARYRQTQFNFAADARRQPGSAAKIWALAALLQAGADPDRTSYLSTPLSVRPGPGQAVWSPRTYDGAYPGIMNVREATVRSDNSVFAQMTLDLGPGRVAGAAKRLGIESPLQPVPSIGLGSQVVTPLEMTTFYLTLARSGIRVDPRILRSVETKGQDQALFERANPRRVMYAGHAARITSILEDNVQRGTGRAAQIPGVPVAGKTGTTDDYKDAWFCGYTPIYTSCVWVGHLRPTPMTNVRGMRVSGGTIPAQIWGKVMGSIHRNQKGLSWPRTKDGPRMRSFKPGWCNKPSIEVIQGPRSITCLSTREDNLTPPALR